MWGLQIHVAAAAPQNWDSLEPASTSTYWLTSQTVSLGRPAKGQAPSAVDIVVAGDSAVSKVHAVLEVAHGGAQLSVQGGPLGYDSGWHEAKGIGTCMKVGYSGC